MNTRDSIESHGAPHQIWVVSWLAYVPHILMGIALLFVMTLAMTITKETGGALIFVSAICVIFGFVAYKAYYLSRIRLYYNDQGIWVFRGVFPWTRGVYGVKWRDFEDCIYTTSFFYWITKGFPVTIRPRFSNNPHIPLPPIHHGRRAVETINNAAAKYVSQTDAAIPR